MKTYLSFGIRDVTRVGSIALMSLLSLALAAPASAKKPKSPARRLVEASGHRIMPPAPGTRQTTGTMSVPTQYLGSWTFDDSLGGADTQGWTTHDLTEQPGRFFHVDDFAGLGGGSHGGLTPLSGTKSLWCGARPSSKYCYYATLPGYGNNWDQRFTSRYFPPGSGSVSVDYRIRYDSEPDYDATYLEYESKSGIWQRVAAYSGTGEGFESVAIPSDSFSTHAAVRFRFVSDQTWSDEDGMYASDGAVIIDSLTVRTSAGIVASEDFESEAVGAQSTTDALWGASGFTPYGNYAGLVDGATVLQEDSLVTNTSHFWSFFNGSTYDYSCGGHPEQPVVPYNKVIEDSTVVLDDEIVSPAFSATVDTDGNPIATANDLVLGFDVYNNLPLDALVFYTVRARSLVGGCWGGWKSINFLYYDGNNPDNEWFRQNIPLTALIDLDATQLQVAIETVDMCPVWCGIYGSGTCHTQAPLIDNVAVFVQSDTLMVTNASDSGPGSLRQAILDANTNKNFSYILFDIPGAGTHSIALSTELPIIQYPVSLDATTQPGYAGTPLVEIVGAGLPSGSVGLTLLTAVGHNIVRGLRFSAFNVGSAGVGIDLIQSTYDNVIEACDIEDCTDGIRVVGDGNRIGGTDAGQANTIQGFTGAGVEVIGGTGNAIRGNHISGVYAAPRYDGVGIDLGGDGVTANDPLDADTGANNLQNVPVITQADPARGTVNGTLDSYPNGTFTLDFYYSDHAYVSSHGGGQVYAGSMTVATDAAGHADFTATIAPATPNNYVVTATATDASGNTSEFSGSYNEAFVVYNTSDSGPGSLRQAILDANADPYASIVLFNIAGTGVHTISPASPLPDITQPVVIDGYSQPGATPNTNGDGLGDNAVLGIVLDGTTAGSSAYGLTSSAVLATIRGLAIDHFGTGGILLSGTTDTVEGCFVGTDAAGATARANGQGVHVTGIQNLIGGSDPAAWNVISGNSGDGVRLDTGSASNIVSENLIGLTADGTSALGNGAYGIRLVKSQSNAIEGNTISGNAAVGVGVVTPTGGVANSIFSNRIGTDVTGMASVGNGTHGVYLSVGSGSGTDEKVGDAGLGNLIAFNGGDGVLVALPASGVQASVRYNTIHSNQKGVVVTSGVARTLFNNIGPNAGLGIDLGDDGVTANDSLDTDTGPNSLQNFPVLTSAVQTASGDIDISGTLNSTPSSNFTVQFFRNTACDPSGNGEGETFIGLATAVTDAAGNGSFTIHGFPNMPGGTSITATANAFTSTGTSEFSPCLEFLNTPAGSNVQVIPADGSTNQDPITLTFDNVSSPGDVLLDITNSGPPPPTGYSFGDTTTYYNLTTTATYSGNIQVCFSYVDSMVTGPESSLKLFHYDDTGSPYWADITTSVDTVANRVCGTTTTLSPFAVAIPVQPTGVASKPPTPMTFALYPCVPNPFNPMTTIRYDVPAGGARVSIVIYDVVGRRVRTLLDAGESAGQHSVQWNGRDQRGRQVASGVYLYRMVAGAFVQTRKMVLLK